MRRFVIVLIAAAGAALGVAAPALASYPGGNGLIAFAKANQIYTISSAGSGLTELTTSASGKNYDPVWNPAGTEIAYENQVSSAASGNVCPGNDLA